MNSTEGNSNGDKPIANAGVDPVSTVDVADAGSKMSPDFAFYEEMGIMVQLNRDIMGENSELTVIGEELLISEKLRKKFRHHIKESPHYLAKLDAIKIRFDQHKCALTDLETRYVTSLTDGLTQVEARIRLERRGPNILTVSTRISLVARWARYCFSAVNALIITAMILFEISHYLYSDLMSRWIQVPLAIVLIGCVLSAYYRDRGTFDFGNIPFDLSQLTKHLTVALVRDGKEQTCRARDLVAGDIVLLSPGSRVPADMRVVSADPDFAVSETIFNVSAKVFKNSALSEKNPFDSPNILFLGSTVLTGTARALILHCGNKSTVGKLVTQIKIARKSRGASYADLRFYYKAITGITLSFALLFVIIGIWVAQVNTNNSNADVNWSVAQQLAAILVLVAGVVVASVPLWFPLIILAGQRFTEKSLVGVRVKNLDVLNSLSALAVLCTDAPVPEEPQASLGGMGIYIVPVLETRILTEPERRADTPPTEIVSEPPSSAEEECLVSPEVLEAIKETGSLVQMKSLVHMQVKVTGRNEWTHDGIFTMTVSGAEPLTDRRLNFLLSSKSHHLVFHSLDLIQKLRIVAGFKKSAKFGTTGYISLNSDVCTRAASLGVGPGRLADVQIEETAMREFAKSNIQLLTNAVVETRRGFNNMRRSVMFLLSSVVPRVMPLLVAIAFNLPVPISVFLVIAGSLLVDLPPSLALLRDPIEADVTLRKPRHEQKDKFVSQRMILISLVFFGPMATLAGFLSYSLMMNDLGFNPNGLGGFGGGTFVHFGNISRSTPGFPATTGYALDITLDVLDNVHLCGRVGGTGSITTGEVMRAIPVSERCEGDIFGLTEFNEYCYNFYPEKFFSNAMRQKIAFYENQKNIAGIIFQRNVTDNGLPVCGDMDYDGIFIPFGFLGQNTQSIVDKAMHNTLCLDTDSFNADTNLPVCFTSEALKYGQTAYFASVAAFTLSLALVALRTELFSFFSIGFRQQNLWVAASVVFSIAIVLIIIYVPSINSVLNTRPVPASSLFIGALPFIAYAFLLEELRKHFMQRNTKWGRWLMKRTMW